MQPVSMLQLGEFKSYIPKESSIVNLCTCTPEMCNKEKDECNCAKEQSVPEPESAGEPESENGRSSCILASVVLVVAAAVAANM
jgi:hypothetical protein